MPNSAQHREKAERNKKFLGTINSATDPEWAIIVAFYTALHLVERLGGCENVHNSKHSDRLDYLKKHKNHRAIHADFLALYDASMVARYGTVQQLANAFPAPTIDTILVSRNLAAIEKHVAFHFAALASTASGS